MDSLQCHFATRPSLEKFPPVFVTSSNSSYLTSPTIPFGESFQIFSFVLGLSIFSCCRTPSWIPFHSVFPSYLAPHPFLKRIKMPFSVLFLLSLSSQVVISQSPYDERSILLDVKEKLGNPPSLQAWNSSSSLCDWHGVQCDQYGVFAVSLPNKTIDQKIPPRICDLKYLILLDVSYNTIPGEFPDILGCSSLKYLHLLQNFFVGPIPANIDRLSHLRHLDLTANNFSGDIPAAIGRLRELQFLSLVQNEFNGTWPREIGNLSNLEYLEMAYNAKFLPSAIPKEFGALKKLRFLSMANANLIGEIPESFKNMGSLEHLDLSLNSLEGAIPGGMLMLENLSHLFLNNNRLSGNIPSAIGALNLKEIDLSQNNLTGQIPQSFGNLHNLAVLNLFWNGLSGEIPTNISLIPTLQTFKVFGNQLCGVLPPEFGLHSELHFFEVFDNKLSGELPQHLCAKGALLGVTASNNNLSGEVPKSLGNCSRLLTLQLDDNGFSGEVPSGIWTSPNMLLVIISGNSFSGSLPSELTSSLTRLEIANNKFSSPIPDKVSSWTGLSVLNASNNMLSGKIPVQLTMLDNLTALSLAGNQFWGELPFTIFSWRLLNYLDLSRNNLSGSIPKALGSLPALNYLNLSRNKFSGQIPPELGRLKLNILDLSSNQLSGMVPTAFQNEAYEGSFFNNPELCLASPRGQLPNRIHSNILPNRWLVVILFFSCLAVIILAVWMVIRLCLWKNHREDDTICESTKFHKCNLDEKKIVSSLTEENLIGNGGAGSVYRVANGNSQGGAVAVKMIPNNRKLDHKFHKQFKAEVDILGSIRHSNIVKLLGCIWTETSNLLVYEHMENRSLDKWLHGKKQRTSPVTSSDDIVLDWPRRLNIAIGAAKGLCYMHEYCPAPIVHGDVKSGNILLDANFDPKIADFGLAKMLAKQGEAVTVSGYRGSYGYIAPEFGSTSKVNEKIDVYSFGVVLLELVTGREAYFVDDKHMGLVDWAWKQFEGCKTIESIVDEDIKAHCDTAQLSNVLELGLMCTDPSPSRRPTMKKVLEILRRCSHQESHARNNGTDNDP